MADPTRFRNTDPLRRGVDVSSMERKRFEYRRMTADELAHDLSELDMAPNTFCRIFGVTGQVMDRWLKGTQDIPYWVFPVLWLMKEADNGIAIARTAAAKHIQYDHKFPQRGEYPYLTIPDDEET